VASALRVASALPDPPFEEATDPPSGLDVELMQAVAERLGRNYDLHRYDGGDFEGMYARLSSRAHDTLSGRLEFMTRDGERFEIGPGDVLLADDTTGGGHSWRILGPEPWRRAYVALAQP
jgi:ABC-type amino acid transport substrate-binding protein